MKKRSGNIVLNIILIVILIVSIVISILEYKDGKDFLINSPYALLRISGGSMEPELHDGDAVLVSNAKFDSLRIGDVIVFSNSDELIVHKITKIDEGYVITQGTANKDPDEPVREKDYKARVVCRIPLLGKIWRMYSTPVLFLIWTLLLVLLIFGREIFSAIYDLIQAAKRSRK